MRRAFKNSIFPKHKSVADDFALNIDSSLCTGTNEYANANPAEYQVFVVSPFSFSANMSTLAQRLPRSAKETRKKETRKCPSNDASFPLGLIFAMASGELIFEIYEI